MQLFYSTQNKILTKLRDNSIQFNTINKTSDIDDYLII